MNKIFQNEKLLQSLVALPLAGFALYRACLDFYAIAWGTGTWRGEFSLTWAALY